MPYNFKRQYTLTVEDTVITEDTEQIELYQEYSYVVRTPDLTEISTSGTVITDLHIEADINFNSKTSGSDSNNSTIKIFNLSPQTRDRISKSSDAAIKRVILEAGYEGFSTTVFTGQVKNITSMQNNTDVVTVLECSDGWLPINSVRFSKSYPRGKMYSEVFNDVVQAFQDNGIAAASGGIILNEPAPIRFSDSPSDLELVKSWTYSGFLKDVLDELCNEFHLTWKIIHSRLYIYPKNYKEMFGFVNISNNNIISLKKRQDNNDNGPTTPNSSGIELTIFLNGRIDPSTKVRIKDDGSSDGSFDLTEYEGEYVISSMRHRLAYEGNEWYTILKLDGDQE